MADKIDRFADKLSAWQEAGERIADLVGGKSEEDAYRILRLRSRELGKIPRMSDLEWQEFTMIVNLTTNLERILPDDVYEKILQELRR